MARYKKLTIIGLIVVGLGVTLALLFLNLESFQNTTIRFQDIFDITNLKTCFDNYLKANEVTYQQFEAECSDKYNQVVDRLSNLKFDEEMWMTILQNIANFLYMSLMYVLNVGLNVLVIMFIFIRESIFGTQYKIKTSKPALILIKIREFIIFIFVKIKQFIKYLFKLLKKYKKQVFITVLVI